MSRDIKSLPVQLQQFWQLLLPGGSSPPGQQLDCERSQDAPQSSAAF